MTDMMDYFNNPDVGSKDQEDDVEFANVTGLVLGRNDSYHNIEMGFKDPDNPSPSKGPSRSISVSHDPSERQVNDAQIGSVTVCDDAFSPELSPVAVAAKKSPAGQPKPLDSYDFSYSADSHDSPSDKGVPGENKYVRQASSPILDHLIENLSDVDESIPKVDSKHTEDHEGDISQFMQSIPSKFDKPKISPRLAEKAEVRRKSLAQDQAVAGMSRQPEQEGNRHPNIPEDPEDMAVIMANKEKKKKKKSSDSYMDEFEVVAAGKKPTQTASKDHDSLDMKNKQPRHRKNNDSYLSDIPVVKVSDTKKSPRQGLLQILKICVMPWLTLVILSRKKG